MDGCLLLWPLVKKRGKVRKLIWGIGVVLALYSLNDGDRIRERVLGSEITSWVVTLHAIDTATNKDQSAI